MRPVNAARRFVRAWRTLGSASAARFVLAYAARRPEVVLTVRGCPRPLVVRPRDSDYFVLRQIFHDLECAMPPAAPPRLIIDCGAYAGYSTVFFATRYPDATVVAVEPDAENFSLLERNCDSLPNLRTIRAAVWPETGRLNLRRIAGSSWGVSVSGPVSGGDGVEAIPMPELIARAGGGPVDILKLDIEGAERDLFTRGSLDWLGRIGMLMIEAHGPECVLATERAVSGRGFTRSQSGEKLIFRREGPLP